MTNQLEALDRLIEVVEAGDESSFRGKNRAVFSTPCQDIDLQLREENCRYAFRGSFDAFMALKEALAPYWAIDQMSSWPGGKSFVRMIGTHVEDDGERWHSHKDGRAEGESETLARAGLLALLRAHRAQIGGQ